ncbi:hypothetical protein VM99_06685 [Pseudomonas chlororaphis]|uniref:Uncharacterized protein n=1 Tax=Pseudomonas chlororaphis TaxID=587753 RepID=A0A0G3GB61_9PSED|nr:hypothetical protein VM99_06685 [Pseudomonas chlororaphis]
MGLQYCDPLINHVKTAYIYIILDRNTESIHHPRIIAKILGVLTPLTKLGFLVVPIQFEF